MPRNTEATLFISNLDDRVDELVLFEVMVQAGPLVEVYIPRDKETNKHRGYGFAEYDTVQSAAYALKLFTGLVFLHNRSIRFAISGADKSNHSPSSARFKEPLERSKLHAEEPHRAERRLSPERKHRVARSPERGRRARSPESSRSSRHRDSRSLERTYDSDSHSRHHWRSRERSPEQYRKLHSFSGQERAYSARDELLTGDAAFTPDRYGHRHQRRYRPY